MKTFFLVMVVLLVGGCATPYGPANQQAAGGYEEMQLQRNTFRVTFHGNGYTNNTRVVNMLLLRASELTTKHGYNHFLITDSSSNVSSSLMTTPTHFGSDGTVYGGDTYTVTKPSATITIQCYSISADVAREVQNDTGTRIYNAKFLVNSIRSKYNL